MGFLPMINAGSTSRSVTDTFRGYNHNLKIADGEFFDTENLTTQYFPVLATRGKRGLVQSFDEFQGIIQLNGKLAYVDDGTLYYDGAATPVAGLTEGPKQLVCTGAYICIFPDGIYYNTVDVSDYGSMTSSLTIENALLTYRMSNSEGVEYGAATKSASPPANPQDGDLWIDTKYTALKSYSAVTLTWTEITNVYTKIILPAQPSGHRPSDLFRPYDGVTLGGLNIDELNGSKILYAVGDDYIVVIGVIDNETTQSGATFQMFQTIPKMDFVIECQNRLWGCYYGPDDDGNTLNEIYASALGDFRNWNQFLGGSTDSYVASVGTEGPWTGAINYLGYPTFFKEDRIHRVAVSAQGAHQIADTPCRGVQKGSGKSLAIVNETLYYKSREGIMGYQGGFPSEISAALGDIHYKDASAGVLNDRYYVSMLDPDNTAHLFVLDVKNALWMREDGLDVSDFIRVGEEIYAVSGDDLIALRGTTGELEDVILWRADTGMMYYEYPDKKYISRFNLRLTMERGSRLKLFIEYDSSGYWTPCGEIVFSGTNTVTVPIRPRRCDHMRLRLEGRGYARIFSIARILEMGSDM